MKILVDILYDIKKQIIEEPYFITDPNGLVHRMINFMGVLMHFSAHPVDNSMIIVKKKTLQPTFIPEYFGKFGGKLEK